MIPRRQFILGATSFLAAHNSFSWVLGRSLEMKANNSRLFPKSISSSSPYSIPNLNFLTEFDGDNEDFPHELLWDKAGFLKKLGSSVSTQKVDVLIVGGGMAGLCSAYFLQNKECLLLEQAGQLGGNSKGYILNNKKTSIGAAYMTIPEDNSTIARVLQDLELVHEGAIEKQSPIFLNKQSFSDFKDSLNPNDLQYFNNLQHRLLQIYESEFPEIPLSQNKKNRNKTLQWDQISFLDWLMQEGNGPVPERIKEFYEMYSWSSFAGSIDEISAAQFLNFIASETQGVWAFPGGNAEITERLFHKISSKIQINTSAFVADIKKDGRVYKTQYIKDSKLHTVESNYVIFSAPKFIADKVLSEDFESQIKSCEKIEYRSYLVANVTLKNKISLPGYDQFMLSGETPKTPSAMKPMILGFPDIVNSNWASNMQSIKDSTTDQLTIYRPFPYSGARQFLFSPQAFEKNKAIITNELANRGLSPQQIKDIYISRWGHALPIAHKGLLADQSLASLYPENAKENFYFVGQDIYANPSFEAAFESAYLAASQIG